MNAKKVLMAAALAAAMVGAARAGEVDHPDCRGSMGEHIVGSMIAFYQTPTSRVVLGCRQLDAMTPAQLLEAKRGILAEVRALPAEARARYMTQVYFGLTDCPHYSEPLPALSDAPDLNAAVNRVGATIERNRRGQDRARLLRSLAEELLQESGVGWCELTPGAFASMGDW